MQDPKIINIVMDKFLSSGKFTNGISNRGIFRQIEGYLGGCTYGSVKKDIKDILQKRGYYSLIAKDGARWYAPGKEKEVDPTPLVVTEAVRIFLASGKFVENMSNNDIYFAIKDMISKNKTMSNAKVQIAAEMRKQGYKTRPRLHANLPDRWYLPAGDLADASTIKEATSTSDPTHMAVAPMNSLGDVMGGTISLSASTIFAMANVIGIPGLGDLADSVKLVDGNPTIVLKKGVTINRDNVDHFFENLRKVFDVMLDADLPNGIWEISLER